MLISDCHPDLDSSGLRNLWIDRILKKQFKYERMVFHDITPQAALNLLPAGFTCDPLPETPAAGTSNNTKVNFTAYTREGIIMQQKQNDLSRANPAEYLPKESSAQEEAQEETRECLVISNVTIHQDEDGLYCLNDLHKAAGNQNTQRPKYWLENNLTKDLIAELENTSNGIPPSEQNQSVKVVKGGNLPQGTYVCKELVYAYAMWISPKFQLAVIRAFDDMVTGRFQHKIESMQQKIGNKQPEGFPDIVERAIEARAWRMAEEHRRQTETLMGTVANGTDEFCWNMAFHVKHSITLRLKNMAQNLLMKFKPDTVAEWIMAWDAKDKRFPYC
ncbi:MAG: KilA-N domain-containing protein [Burkholderiales bacterium]